VEGVARTHTSNKIKPYFIEERQMKVNFVQLIKSLRFAIRDSYQDATQKRRMLERIIFAIFLQDLTGFYSLQESIAFNS